MENSGPLRTPDRQLQMRDGASCLAGVNIANIIDIINGVVCPTLVIDEVRHVTV